MDLWKQGMKGPTRPAPAVPKMTVNRYSPVTNWNDDPFGADVFEPTPQCTQKKKPPPRPPPPKVNQPDIPAKPSHFIRRPTVLSSLLSRKSKTTVNNSLMHHPNHQNVNPEFQSEVDTTGMFPKCEPKNVQTGALIDLSSPPSSPTFTTRSSSDGLSVDSFGSDATTSTNHHNTLSNGNASQAESGFEDDFDLFLHARKSNKEDSTDDFSAVDPFSPQQISNKPPIMKKPVISRDLFDSSSNLSSQMVPSLKGPTIIRAKPSRPKPPDNSALLKSSFGNSFPVTSMNVNTTTPIQKVSNGFDNFDSKPLSWDDDGSPVRESSPPMPSIPPPPPPPEAEDITWSDDIPADFDTLPSSDDEPYAVALFDYYTGHPDDLCFSANSRIKLIRRENEEWLYGSVQNGACGLFPSNYVEIKVPLPNESSKSPAFSIAKALYDFDPVQPGDLRFSTGDVIYITHKLNEEWYFGECNGAKGQFPVNYVQIC